VKIKKLIVKNFSIIKMKHQNLKIRCDKKKVKAFPLLNLLSKKLNNTKQEFQNWKYFENF